MPPKIDIVVGGRFHADKMFAALQADFTPHLYTSLPRSRFPSIPAERVSSLLIPELILRGGSLVGLANLGDLVKIRTFGATVGARVLRGDAKELVIGWSSFVLETFLSGKHAKKILVRDSTHIGFQTRILESEYAKLGFNYPNRRLCEERELEEYAIADQILVPSAFARRTFLDFGFAPARVRVLKLGVDTGVFRAGAIQRENRPLKVVYFGTATVRKGVQYLLQATKELVRTRAIELHLIGPVDRQFAPILAQYKDIHYQPAMPHSALAQAVREMDVFVLPSVEDGYGLVVPQAMSSGLLPIVTDHCGASESVKDGFNGFVVPALSSEAITERLEYLLRNPDRVPEMRARAAESAHGLQWDEYAAQMRQIASLWTSTPSAQADPANFEQEPKQAARN